MKSCKRCGTNVLRLSKIAFRYSKQRSKIETFRLLQQTLQDWKKKKYIKARKRDIIFCS